jgi:hypothetical protein
LITDFQKDALSSRAEKQKNMKKINDYRKLLGVTKDVELKDLKTIYRNMMKDCHPDKFYDNAELKEQAELRSKEIIEAYHFLVSIAPETITMAQGEYQTTLTTVGILNYTYEKSVLKVTFSDGNVYEYFGVPRNIYIKLVNSDSCARFIRRHISESFVYRSVSKRVVA